jgi:NAD(P)H dehydrogenase (quinone)
MIVVTGATGLLGGAVVERLLTRVPATEIGVSVRDPAKAEALADRGVRVRRGDYDDAASLSHPFEGAEQLLLVSAAATGEAALRQHRTAIDAARAAGVRRIVYTSHMGANPASAFAPMPDHAATEALLADSGLAFTALRNGFYASSGRMLLGEALETGELAAPADGPVSWTAHDDLAEAAAIVLTDEGRFEGPTPPLTGSAALDLAGVAAAALGRPIRRTVLTDAQYREALPEAAADMLLGLFAASRAGEFAAVDPTLGELLGRPPLTVRDVLAKD